MRAKGGAGGPFLIEGAAANPVFRPDVKALVSGKVQSLEKNQVGKGAGSLLGGVGRHWQPGP